MNADVLELISIIAFVCAATLCVITIVMFFKMNIRAIVDDLSGKKAERQIREMREQNKLAESRVRMPMDLVSRNAYQTERQGAASGRMETSLLVEDTVWLDEETAMLDEGTTVLDEGTIVLEEETTVLSGETTLLDEGTVMLETETTLENGYCLLLEEIVVHTNEGV